MTPIGTREARDATTDFGQEVVFKEYSLGVSTNRDSLAYGFQRVDLEAAIAEFCVRYSAELDRWRRLKRKPKSADDFVDYDALKWSRKLKRNLVSGKEVTFDPASVRTALYRPFTKKYLYYNDSVVDHPALFGSVFPTDSSDNLVMCVPTVGSRDRWCVMVTDVIPDLHVLSNDGFQAFPLYVYTKDGRRNDNVTEWWRQTMGDRLGQEVSALDAFYYAYAVFHHPRYRSTFSTVLRRDLPRLPVPHQVVPFRAFVESGKELVRLHIGYEQLKPWPLKWIERADATLDYRVERPRLSRDRASVAVNKWLTLADIPEKVFGYALGNRSALEWVIDQYQVIRDSDGNLAADPNRSDDPEYIVRLIGQVIRVSIDTADIVSELPALDALGLLRPR